MITVPTGDLVGILSDVILFASADKDFPSLNSVRIEWDGQQLHALATDRYRLAISTWHPDDDPPEGVVVEDDLFTRWGSGDDPWAILIPLDDAKDLASNYKLPTKEQYTPLTVDYDRDTNRIKVVRTRETGHMAVTATIDGRPDEYPDVRRVLSDRDIAVKVDGIAFDAKRLADFGKVRQRGPMAFAFTGAGTLAHVSIGERFIGAIMPVKTGGDDEPTED